ncbi:MAG: transcriptional regulator [Zunongwangia sp.]|uniref:helix-turn-helix domain-containing protein n=1 Tax=Zunongwangia profunda TaxID=398743 RepID=UPI000C951CFE|nr:helix-turn-helix transcriptional regulator [Zunongwangia profunda]MAG86166.1 transcriptional regulator [Flavobacteriaceae bacterium]MAO36502.1 transcriptional regulator [Zunongwangia sp.]|tara:strand:+ start:3239 stop:3631 length:393 start_codon:yes stop_codon:yes gene_type:complete
MKNTFTSNPSHVGRKIERIRVLRGFTQSELGERLGGISKQAISKLEQTETIDDDRIEEVARALGVTSLGLKKFNEESVLYATANFYEGSHSINTNINTIINDPVDKIIEFYEKRLQDLRNEIVDALKDRD